MGRFIQDGTGVVVSVADEKDHRFESGWKPYAEDEKPAKKTSTASRKAGE